MPFLVSRDKFSEHRVHTPFAEHSTQLSVPQFVEVSSFVLVFVSVFVSVFVLVFVLVFVFVFVSVFVFVLVLVLVFVFDSLKSNVLISHPTPQF